MTKKLAPAMMAVAILFGCLGSTHAANLLILKSTVSDILPEGGILDGSKQLTLPAGAAVTLVGEAGNKINLKGPYSGVPGAAEQSAGGGIGRRMLSALSRLISGTPRDASKLGVTRGGPSAMSADLWKINISKSGDHCLPADMSAELWRASSDKASTLSISRDRSKGWVKMQWPAGDDSLAWPGGVEVIDGATYLVRLGAGIKLSEVVLHLVPNDLPSGFHRAGWMADYGCSRQARTLLSSLE